VEEGSKEKPWEKGVFSARVTDPGAKVNPAWFRGGWWDPLTMAWKDAQEAACYDRKELHSGGPSPGGTVFVRFKLKAGQSRTIVLQLAWYSGQTKLRRGSDPKSQPASQKHDGSSNYVPWYANRFRDINELGGLLARQVRRTSPQLGAVQQELL